MTEGLEIIFSSITKTKTKKHTYTLDNVIKMEKTKLGTNKLKFQVFSLKGWGRNLLPKNIFAYLVFKNVTKFSLYK